MLLWNNNFKNSSNTMQFSFYPSGHIKCSLSGDAMSDMLLQQTEQVCCKPCVMGLLSIVFFVLIAKLTQSLPLQSIMLYSKEKCSCISHELGLCQKPQITQENG